MEAWLKISITLCFFGFFKEMRLCENYSYAYFTGDRWKLSFETIELYITPFFTYSTIILTTIMLPLIDIFRYKVFIVMSAGSCVITSSFLLWGTTVLHLQIATIFYGLFFATEVAYFTYIYAKVPKEHYLQVTSHTRAALIFGHGVSGLLSQLLVEFQLLDYRQLNYITFSCMIVAIIWALMLPSVETSIYFHSQSADKKSNTQKYITAFQLMKHHFVASYSQWYVIKWSVWWSLSTCGFIHVQLFMQPLWSYIVAETDEKLYNGIAETVMTVAGFIATVIVGVLKVDWTKFGDLALILCSTLSAVFIIISSQAGNVLVSYAAYTAYGGVYYFVITIATSEVAKNILQDSYGLVFGLNTLVALMLQSLVLLVFVTGAIGWALEPREQHVAYGLCHAGIAILFLIITLVKLIKRWWFNSGSSNIV